MILAKLFYLVPVVLAVGLATRVQALWEFHAMWNQGMDVNSDEVTVALISAIVQLVAIVGLLRRRRWAKILSYVLFSVLGVSIMLLFLHASLGGAFASAQQLGRAFLFAALYISGAGLCIFLVKKEYDTSDDSSVR